ncbi:MAG: SDR family oxidoreductase [Polaromonas sp.]|nr:SDR family oxidoreductase [Gemmatimonadaceae bacterium]
MKRTYLIVGHSSGIGLALTRQALDAGHAVLGLSRRSSGITLPGLAERQADVLEVDLATLDLPQTLDGVAYCPGTINLKSFRALKEADFLGDFRATALGTVGVLQATASALKAGQQPGVVLFSTVAVQQGMPFHASVAMAKGAIEGLTRSLAAEWAPAIRVNAIAPSLTRTPLAERLLSSEERVQASRDRHPLRQIGEPDDVASAALYLLGDQARWVTGQVWGVDGGMSSVRA